MNPLVVLPQLESTIEVFFPTDGKNDLSKRSKHDVLFALAHSCMLHCGFEGMSAGTFNAAFFRDKRTGEYPALQYCLQFEGSRAPVACSLHVVAVGSSVFFHAHVRAVNDEATERTYMMCAKNTNRLIGSNLKAGMVIPLHLAAGDGSGSQQRPWKININSFFSQLLSYIIHHVTSFGGCMNGVTPQLSGISATSLSHIASFLETPDLVHLGFSRQALWQVIVGPAMRSVWENVLWRALVADDSLLSAYLAVCPSPPGDAANVPTCLDPRTALTSSSSPLEILRLCHTSKGQQGNTPICCESEARRAIDIRSRRRLVRTPAATSPQLMRFSDWFVVH